MDGIDIVSAQADTIGCFASSPPNHICDKPRDHAGDHRCAGPDCDVTFTDTDEGVACYRCADVGGPPHKPCRDHGRAHCSSDFCW
jgi:hypothetical protein